MQSYVVVVGRPGRRIPPGVLDYLRQDDAPDLCFVPDDHVYWTDDSCRVAYGGWQNRTDIVALGSHWHVDEHRLTAFSGRMWPKGGMWRAGDSWAEQLAGYAATHPLVDPGQPFDGLYTAVSIGASGRGVVVTDPCSIAMLYRAENDDVVAVSTSAHLAARVAAWPDPPDRDPLGAAWLPLLGSYVGDRTGYVGTRVLPVGSYVEIDPRFGCRVRFANPTPWADDADASAGPSDDEAIEQVHEDLLASVRSIAELPARQRVADITGGRDSRLILAMMLETGVTDRFTFRTRSADDRAPDSVVGRMIAERFQLNQELVTIAAFDDPVAFQRRMHTHVFHTAGMTSCWDLGGSLGISTTPRVTGFVGEIMRSHFTSYPESLREARRALHARTPVDARSLVRPDVRATLVADVDRELFDRLDAIGSTQDRLDEYYVRHRLRRWFGTNQELGHLGNLYPLYQLRGMQAAFTLGPAARANDRLAFALTRAASPDLAKLPLANSGWHTSVYAHLPDAADYETPPVKRQHEAQSVWQPKRLESNWEMLEGYLLDEPSSPIYDILDRDALMSALPAYPTMRGVEKRQLMDAMTAAVWLGHHESRSRIGGQWVEPAGAAPARKATATTTAAAAAPDPPRLVERVRRRARRVLR
jgi:hypothetical protein